MTIPILTTKLSIPPKREDWVRRSRLIDRLDQGSQRKLILISAPAGFGKTTLIASWLHDLRERQQPSAKVAWLSLEEGDNDTVRFLSHFIAAWQTIDPGTGQTAQAFLETPNIPKINHLMTMLINDLALLSEPSILVLDDYQVITHPDLRGAIAFFLDHLPPRCHLVIATREEPSLPIPRLHARWEVMEIRLQDLRFNSEETEAFLKRTMGLALTAEATQTLENRTEGWIAGLQMAALSLRGRARIGGHVQMSLEVSAFGGGHRYVIDYLAAEVLRQQSEEIRTFLRQTAILDRFNAFLCDAVTGRHDSQTILTHLENANLFLISLDNQRQWYRYHPLFADFLRTELAESERQSLHHRASQWYEEHGFTPEAITHALAAHDTVAAVRLIRNSAEETLRNGGFTTLLGWIDALPEEVVRTHSDLSVHKGWILYMRGEIATAETYATLAVENQRPDDSPYHRAMLLAFRAYLAIMRGEPEQAVLFAQESLVLLGETESFYRTTALSHLGKAQRLVGDRQTAIQTLRQAIAVGQRLGNHMMTLEALGYLTQLLYQQGQLREAIKWCEEAAGLHLDARGHPLPMSGLIYVPLGMLYYETNDLTRAYNYLTTGIALCQQVGTVYPTLLGQRTLAKLHYANGEIEAAWETLAAARQLAAKSEDLRRIRLVSAVTAELQLRQGNIVAASHSLANLTVEFRDMSEQENITNARLLLAQGQTHAALSLLHRLEQRAQQQSRFGSLIAIHLLQALANQAMNHSSAATDSLGQAISLAASEGYRRVFLDAGRPAAVLLEQRQHLAPEFISSLLEAFSKGPGNDLSSNSKQASAALAQPFVEPLTETQLTILRQVAEGLSNREIAAKLSITEGTTKWHLNQIYGKLNVSSRTQAVAQARHLRML